MAKKKSKRPARQHTSLTKSKTVKSGKRGPANSETRKAATTHRFIGWLWDDEDFRACSERAQRARRQYRESRPTRRDVRAVIEQFLTNCAKQRGERAEGLSDPEERAMMEAMVDRSDSPFPEEGATTSGIIYELQQRFPGIPDDVVHETLNYLKRRGKICRADDQSLGKPVKVWRVCPGKADQSGSEKQKKRRPRRRKQSKHAGLTKRQKMVLDYLNDGHTQAEAARHFDVTPGAISQMRGRIRQRIKELNTAGGRSVNFRDVTSLQSDYGPTGKNCRRAQRQRKGV
ncbi:MAG: hypothetical protein WBE26_14915 [Phycisphaerae bacterium]